MKEVWRNFLRFLSSGQNSFVFQFAKKKIKVKTKEEKKRAALTPKISENAPSTQLSISHSDFMNHEVIFLLTLKKPFQSIFSNLSQSAYISFTSGQEKSRLVNGK